ncbi:MAG: mitochondrial fission ELM1 family protein [Fretibacterium sp.]|nr:mitochondrial fission ELM1 family protein [Fretibacterium sp.]
MTEKNIWPKSVVVLSDGIRGHKHQSLGIARWLERLCGATVCEVEVPHLLGLKRFCRLKLTARRLASASSEEARRWLSASGFAFETHADALSGGAETLFISTGSSAAPFCLALARNSGGRSAVVMTPSVLGTQPFDFAIVPEHDRPAPADNLLMTLGAPNHIYRPELQAASAELFAPLMPFPQRVVVLLLGGGDANYELTASWVHDVLAPLSKAVEKQGAALLVTTSRRTGKEADSAVESVLAGSPAVRYLLLASRSAENPIPAMLGTATHVLVTEDSVSMVSEAATAGFRVGLIRVGRRQGPLVKLRNILGGGTARFDALFDAMAERGLVEDLGANPDFDAFLAPAERRTDTPFNEAKRAAEWILSRRENP